MAESLADLFVRLTADTSEFKQPLDDAGVQLDDLSDKANAAGQKMGDAFNPAAEGAGKFGASLDEAKHHSEDFNHGLEETIEHLKQFAEALGIEELLREFGTEALKAFGELQKADIALTALTGDAEASKEALEGLKGLAISDALSFPSLIEAQVRMTAFGISLEAIPQALQAAADAAAATNRDFESVANAIGSMSLSGMAGARQLKALGISPGDLSEVLGVSIDEVKSAFKDYLDETERAEALSEAIFNKFGGTAEQTAQGLLGQWKNLGTEFHFILEGIGEALEPSASAMLKWAQSGISQTKELISELKDFSTLLSALPGFKEIVISVKYASNVTTAGLDLFGNPLNFIRAGLGLDKIPGSGEAPQGDALPKGAAGDFGGEAGEPTPFKESVADIVAHNKAIAEAKTAYQEMVDAEIGFHNSVVDMYNTFPATYEQYVKRLDDGGKKATSSLGEITGFINKAVSLSEGLTGKPLDDLVAWVVTLTNLQDKAKEFAAEDSFNTAAVKIAALVDKFPKQADEISNLDSTLGALITDMAAAAATVPDHFLNQLDISALVAKLLESQKALDESTQKLEQSFTKAWDAYEVGVRKAVAVQTQITTPLKTRLLGVSPGETAAEGSGEGTADQGQAINAAYEATMKLRAAFQGLHVDLNDVTKQNIEWFQTIVSGTAQIKPSMAQFEEAWDHVRGSLNKLAQADLPAALKGYDAAIAKARDLGEAEGLIIQKQEARLQAIIRNKTLTGEAATAEIIQLEKLGRAQDALVFSATALGTLYVEIGKDFDQAFGMMGKAVADNIIDAKNWGEVWMNLGKSITKMFLEDIVGTAFKAFEQAILKNTGLIDAMSNGITSAMGKFTNLLGVTHGGIGKAAAGSVGDIANASDVRAGIGEDVLNGGFSGGGGSSGGGGGIGSLAGITGLVGAAAAVGSGIAQGFQMARLLNLTSEIEVTTRHIENNLVAIQGTLLTYLPELKHLPDIWGELINQFGKLTPSINQMTEKLNDNLSNTGEGGGFWGTSGGPGARKAGEGFANDPVTAMASDIHSLATNLLPPHKSTHGSALDLLGFTTREMHDTFAEAVANAFPVLHPAEYAARQAQERTYAAALDFLKEQQANPYGPYGALPAIKTSGMDAGEPVPTMQDLTDWMNALKEFGIQGGAAPFTRSKPSTTSTSSASATTSTSASALTDEQLAQEALQKYWQKTFVEGFGMPTPDWFKPLSGSVMPGDESGPYSNSVTAGFVSREDAQKKIDATFKDIAEQAKNLPPGVTPAPAMSGFVLPGGGAVTNTTGDKAWADFQWSLANLKNSFDTGKISVEEYAKQFTAIQDAEQTRIQATKEFQDAIKATSSPLAQFGKSMTESTAIYDRYNAQVQSFFAGTGGRPDYAAYGQAAAAIAGKGGSPIAPSPYFTEGGTSGALSQAEISTLAGQYQQQLNAMQQLRQQQDLAALAVQANPYGTVDAQKDYLVHWAQVYEQSSKTLDARMQWLGNVFTSPAALANQYGLNALSYANAAAEAEKSDPRFRLDNPFAEGRMRAYGAPTPNYDDMLNQHISRLSSQTTGGPMDLSRLQQSGGLMVTAPVTVQAFDQSGRSMADGLVLALRQQNIRIR